MIQYCFIPLVGETGLYPGEESLMAGRMEYFTFPGIGSFISGNESYIFRRTMVASSLCHSAMVCFMVALTYAGMSRPRLGWKPSSLAIPKIRADRFVEWDLGARVYLHNVPMMFLPYCTPTFQQKCCSGPCSTGVRSACRWGRRSGNHHSSSE